MKMLPAREEDAFALARIASSNPCSAHWTAADFAKEIQHPFTKIYKMENNQNILGFICYRVCADAAELTNFAVDADNLKQGVGSFLLEHSLGELKKNEIKEITLEVNVNNEAALNLYSKFLFKRVSTRKKFYNNTDDAALMQRIL